MKPFNPEKAQFYYDTANHLEECLMRSGNQLLEYEDKIRTLKNENAELKKQVDSLIANLAAAHEDREEEAKLVFVAKQVEIPELLRENAALREDKERLDWVIKDSYYHFFFKLSSDLEKGRRQIDAARKEAQP